MRIVAEYLQHEALNRKDIEADLFARSAFNRFYYSTFLVIRERLASLDPKWQSNLKHSDVPDILKKEIKKRIVDKRGIIKKFRDDEALKKCSTLLSLNTKLASEMTNARAVRTIADYEPDEKVKMTNSEFTLSGTSSRNAQNWLIVAQQWSNLVVDLLE